MIKSQILGCKIDSPPKMDVIAFRIDDFRHTKEPAPVDGVTHGGTRIP